MSLKSFHLFFITICILMCLFVGAWGVRGYLSGGSLQALSLGFLGYPSAIGLMVYAVKAFRKLKSL